MCAFVPGAKEPFVYAEARAIGFCRTCYDHLAGYVGVQIAEAMERHALLVPSGSSKQYGVTSEGRAWFGHLGVSATDPGDSRRKLAFRCHDWTERQYHLGGVLGSALLERLRDLGWVVRDPELAAGRRHRRGSQRPASRAAPRPAALRYAFTFGPPLADLTTHSAPR